jgi:hypothetical protein
VCTRRERASKRERERERVRLQSESESERERERVRLESKIHNVSDDVLPQVSYADSLKISLALKKSLVDKGLLDITQNDMEEALFSIMRAHGYGEDYVARYLRHNN